MSPSGGTPTMAELGRRLERMEESQIRAQDAIEKWIERVDERLRLVERWAWSIPSALFLSVAAIAVTILLNGGV